MTTTTPTTRKQIEKRLVAKIAAAWSRAKDNAQPMALEFEIQFALECSWGKAATLANMIRCTWPVA